MSPDYSYSICRPCGVYQDNGVVVGRVTADWHPTVASFDAQMVRDSWPADGGNDANRLIRKFLIDHEAHIATGKRQPPGSRRFRRYRSPLS